MAAGDPERSAVQFFEDTVPTELQDNPELLEVFLNGGTVNTPEYVYTRGRAGGEYELVEQELPDRDWSHDVSRANGGSDSADNGRWEEASTNRARGSANTTAEEQATADAATEADTETLLSSVEEVTEAGAWGVAADVAGGFLEASLDGLLPVAASAVAAKKAADQFEDTTDKVGYGALAAGAAAVFFASPLGAPVVGGYVCYKVAQRGVKLYQKHVAA